MNRWAIIRQRAASLLAEYERRTGTEAFGSSIGSYVHLKEIARQLFQLSVVPDDELQDGESGFLDLNERTITFRPSESPERQKSTIAHELGHHALEHPPRPFPDTSEDIDDVPHAAALSVKNGVYRAYSSRDRWELEANVFAAELLMPIDRVRTMVLTDRTWSVNRLATYFGVTRSAMCNQLAAALLTGSPEPTKDSSASSTTFDLDGSQEAAATVEGAALVLAGPGSGKTRVLVKRFDHLVRDRGVDPERILALTFSNKAVEELHERLTAIMPSEAHRITVSTFHGLGWHLLQEYGHNVGLKPDPTHITEIDAFVMLRQRLGKVPLGSFEDLHRPTRNLRTILSAISRAKDELCGPEQYAQLVQEWNEELKARPMPTDDVGVQAHVAERLAASTCADIAVVYATYQEWLREGGYVDYGDLIVEAVRLFENKDVAQLIRDRWDYILVDEFQDINYASGRLVRALDGGRGVVWAVGDPRQSIYQFRGASPANLRDFETDYPSASIISLEWNYRSLEDVVRAGLAIDIPITTGSEGTPLVIKPLRASRGRAKPGPGVRIVEAASGDDELASLVDGVRDELKGRPAGEIAVLCSKRDRAQEVSAALEAEGILSDWAGALEDTPIFKDLLGLLLLVTDRVEGLVRLARLPEHFLSESDLQLLLDAARRRGGSALAVLLAAIDGEINGLSVEGAQQVVRYKNLVNSLRHRKTPWSTLASYVFEHAAWTRDLLHDDSPAGRRKLATLRQVADLAREFEDRSTLVGGTGCAPFIEFVRNCLECGSLGDAPVTLDSDDVVHILTVHGSKGLEWPVVFVPNLTIQRFEMSEDSSPIPPGLIHGAAADEAEIGGLCLFYVAVTRARDRLVLSRAAKYGRSVGTPLPSLESITEVLAGEGLLDVAMAPVRAAATTVPGAAFPKLNVTLGTPPSPRALEEFDDCSRRFLYSSIYRLQDDDRGYLDFDQVVHRTLAWAVDQAAVESPPNVEAALAELSTAWAQGDLVGHWYEEGYRRKAEAIVDAFVSRISAGARVAVRRRRELRVGDDQRIVNVTIDEEEVVEGIRIYRRVHFGRPAKTHSTNDDRPALIAALHKQDHRDEPFEIRLLYPLHGVEELITPTPTVIKNRTTKSRRLIQAIEDGRFPPKPSRYRCSSCPYNLICPA